MKKWLRYHFKILYSDFKGEHEKFVNTCLLIAKQAIYACCNENLTIANKIHQMKRILQRKMEKLKNMNKNGMSMKRTYW